MFNLKSKQLNNILVIALFVILVYLVSYYNISNNNSEQALNQKQEKFAVIKYKQKAKRFLEYFENFVENVEDKEEPIIEHMTESTSLKLFYTPTCPHSLNFLPYWKQITETLSATQVKTEMINCKEDSSTCRKYGIKGVPSLVFSHNGDSNIYRGQMDYQNVIQMVKDNGIHISDNTFEGFANYITLQDEMGGKNNKPDVDKDCPPITFYKDGQKSFCASSNYLNGCLELSDKDTLKPFDGAFSVIGSYLSSVPNRNKMIKCAKKQKETIRNWLLCNGKELSDKVKQDPDNASIVRAIMKSCLV